jgi:hypothetical protein
MPSLVDLVVPTDKQAVGFESAHKTAGSDSPLPNSQEPLEHRHTFTPRPDSKGGDKREGSAKSSEIAWGGRVRWSRGLRLGVGGSHACKQGEQTRGGDGGERPPCGPPAALGFLHHSCSAARHAWHTHGLHPQSAPGCPCRFASPWRLHSKARGTRETCQGPQTSRQEEPRQLGTQDCRVDTRGAHQ